LGAEIENGAIGAGHLDGSIDPYIAIAIAITDSAAGIEFDVCAGVKNRIYVGIENLASARTGGEYPSSEDVVVEPEPTTVRIIGIEQPTARHTVGRAGINRDTAGVQNPTPRSSI